MKINQSALSQPRSPSRLQGLPLFDQLLILIFAAALIGFAATGVVTARTVNEGSHNVFSSSTISGESSYSIERRAFDLINQERVKNDRKPLRWIEKAAAAARFHSANMARGSFLGHRDLEGTMVDDRADRFGLSNWSQIGENVAWISGYEDPAARAVFSWMRSAGHRKNIMESKYRETGLGLAIGNDGKYYFTQVFVAGR